MILNLVMGLISKNFDFAVFLEISEIKIEFDVIVGEFVRKSNM